MATMRRYERIGVDVHWASRVLEISLRLIEQGLEVSPERSDYGIFLGAFSLRHASAAIGFYLRDEEESAVEMAQKFLKTLDIYFNGDWRSSVPRIPGRPGESEYWKQGGGPWFEHFQLASAFGLALGQWDKVVQLSRFVVQARPDRLAHKHEVMWAKSLAHAIIQENDGRCTKLDTAQGRCGSSYVSHLTAACGAICERSSADANSEFHEAFVKYVRHIKGRDEVVAKLWMDGTSLYHLARRVGMEMAVDEVLLDHLVIM